MESCYKVAYFLGFFKEFKDLKESKEFKERSYDERAWERRV